MRTLKRDYVQVTPLPDAETVLRLLPSWFEDTNARHPHSGLTIHSPGEFMTAQTATARVSSEIGARSGDPLACEEAEGTAGGRPARPRAHRSASATVRSATRMLREVPPVGTPIQRWSHGPSGTSDWPG